MRSAGIEGEPRGLRPLVGIFVGGRSSRMGRAKGLLSAPGEANQTLVGRLIAQVQMALPEAQVVLVGLQREYECLGYPFVADEISDQGPLGGIVALLRVAESQQLSSALVIACDFPYLNASLIERLAFEQPKAPLLCPLLDEFYQALFCRYSTSLLTEFHQALLTGRRGLQPLLRHFDAATLPVDEGERRLLQDWDTPEEMQASLSVTQESSGASCNDESSEP